MSGIFFNENQKRKILYRFSKLSSSEDFIVLLNFIEDFYIEKEDKHAPLILKNLYFLSKTKDNRYTEILISKKSGDIRVLNVPDILLKRVQKVINYLLQIIFEPHSHHNSNGFLLGKDIIRNAIPHVNKNYLLNLDIEDFFPSINFRRVKTVLELPPFNLNGDKEKISFLIANLCTHNNSLPQGAPTSPILSNIVTQRLDRKLTKICFYQKIKYSRYADDLTFSSNKNIFNEKFIHLVSKVVEKENFKVNTKKTRIRTLMDRQEVTGLIVNQKLNIKREYFQKARAMLNNWEKGGLAYAENIFKYHQEDRKAHYDFRQVLLGHISFIKLVKGNVKSVNDLKSKFNFLNNQINYDHITEINVKNRLKKDNIRMEKLLLDETIPNEDLFIMFCTSAFHQIENLINYHYWKKFPVFENLLQTLILENPTFKRKKLEDLKNQHKKIKNLNISVLVYSYEKEFYFDLGKYYNKQITYLREIRNDESHRCQVINLDKEQIISDYKLLEMKIELMNKNKKMYNPTPDENKLIQNYSVMEFLKQSNFKAVRQILRETNENIKVFHSPQKHK